MSEIEALQNFAERLNLTVHMKHMQDKRRTVNKYFASYKGISVSPPLDYEQLNHFFMGWNNCQKATLKLN
jgi:hypothetical protein